MRYQKAVYIQNRPYSFILPFQGNLTAAKKEKLAQALLDTFTTTDLGKSFIEKNGGFQALKASKNMLNRFIDMGAVYRDGITVERCRINSKFVDIHTSNSMSHKEGKSVLVADIIS